MIAEFQQIRTQAVLIQTPESGAESAIDLQIQFPTETPARTNRDKKKHAAVPKVSADDTRSSEKEE